MQVARVVSSVLGLCIAITMATHVSAQTSLPYPDSHFKGFVGSTYLDSAPATFPQPVKAPKGAPNVLLILLDDVGFGQFAVTGGGVPSPSMEQLAKEGLLYNRFHTTALLAHARRAADRPQSPKFQHGHYYRTRDWLRRLYRHHSAGDRDRRGSAAPEWL